MSDFFNRRLLDWYDRHGRKDLPWQQQPTPYHVWLSEIMLQQTQVATVIPYYQRFTERFPDVKSLADADVETVLGYWAGLGYYARGRNLHRAAQQMVAEHAGQVPNDYQALLALPGIGRSTAGAIMSLAFDAHYPILDGNVKRVLTRFAGIEGWPGQTHVEKRLWQLADELLPNKRIAAYIQAQMDLGATLCTRSRPQCERCPLQTQCIAYRDGRQAELPTRRPPKTVPERHQVWLIEQSADHVLLHKRPDKGIWGGMWSFSAYDGLESLLAQHHIDEDALEKLTAFTHTFTHFRLQVQPVRLKHERPVTMVAENNTHTWVKLDNIDELALPAPVKTLIQKLN